MADYKVKVYEVKAKPFTSDEGKAIPYFWCKAERQDGVSITFGTLKERKASEEFEVISLEKTEGVDGKFRYKELVPKLSV